VRHRHVLALREDSGWTYQQIADHEGVEIGTIETLLWRARQAFKREFLVLSESKGPLAGFLLGVGAAIRTVVVRSAHRVAALQSGGNGGSGGGLFRNAFAGVAITTAAVAAAFVAPHAFDSSPQTRVALPAPAPAAAGATGTGLSVPSITPAVGAASAASPLGSGPATGSGTLSGSSPLGSDPLGSDPVAGLTPVAASSSDNLLSEASKSTAAVTGLAAPLSGVVSGALAASPLKSLVPATTGAVATTVGELGSAVGAGSTTTQRASSLSSPAGSSAIVGTTTTAVPTIGNGIESAASSLISTLHLTGQG
jgi:hypothetical protein